MELCINTQDCYISQFQGLLCTFRYYSLSSIWDHLVSLSSSVISSFFSCVLSVTLFVLFDLLLNVTSCLHLFIAANPTILILRCWSIKKKKKERTRTPHTCISCLISVATNITSPVVTLLGIGAHQKNSQQLQLNVICKLTENYIDFLRVVW